MSTHKSHTTVCWLFVLHPIVTENNGLSDPANKVISQHERRKVVLSVVAKAGSRKGEKVPVNVKY